jgi:hypothetical protein
MVRTHHAPAPFVPNPSFPSSNPPPPSVAFSPQEALEAAAALVGLCMPRAPELTEDDLDRLPGPGDGDLFVPQVASDVAEVLNSGPRAASAARAARALPAPATYVTPAVEHCIVTLAPLLMTLVCRTKNLGVRCAGLLALSRMAYDAASARCVTGHAWMGRCTVCREIGEWGGRRAHAAASPSHTLAHARKHCWTLARRPPPPSPSSFEA